MTDLGAFFEGQVRAWADDRAFWDQFAAFRIKRTCGVRHATGGKCVVSPGHRGMHVLPPAEGEMSLRYFDNSEAELRTLAPRIRLWVGVPPDPRNEDPREHDRILGSECVCNIGVRECPIHPGRLRSMIERIRFRVAFDERVAAGRRS